MKLYTKTKTKTKKKKNCTLKTTEFRKNNVNISSHFVLSFGPLIYLIFLFFYLIIKK